VVNIFARKITDQLTSLVKQIDTAVGKNEEKQLAAFLVLLSEDPEADAEALTALAQKHEIKNVPLTIFDGLEGPPSYKLAEDVEVTVHVWVKHKVEANRAYAKGSLNEKGVKEVLADTEKVLSAS
jgi:hypothetical protein